MKSERIEKVFDILAGNSGLTEEFLYENQPISDEDKISILSSATEKANLMGFISRNAKLNGKALKIFKGPCVLIARNGYAGTMTYIESMEFTANDHAYVLIPKKEWKDAVDLRWFVYQYQELFYRLVTSKSDNATFNKEYAERQIVKLPKIDEQERISNKLREVDKTIQNFEYAIEALERISKNTTMTL